ncbi:hypothetical protein AGMMS49982_14340 [Bacteroidia bacterium]|nr:hypothetical protein AGMMS49982_14340 [Bacteroidia bacterium]
MSTFAQSIHLSGTVFDNETQRPISGISIYTKDSKIGTISTAKGNFSLDIPASKANSYLYFTGVGYEPVSLLISSKATNPLSIKLIPKTYTLKEFYVMPDTSLIALLRKAYHKIPENYPDRPTRYEGFYQESCVYQDSLIELVEAVLSVYKESYKDKKEAPGQVEILKSRHIWEQKSLIASYGGAFDPIERDFVLKRESYIHPDKLKNYRYTFNGITSNNDRNCYEIEFHSKGNEDKIRGTMLIDEATLAYVSFNVHGQYKGNVALSALAPPLIESNENIVYEQLNGKWYLKQTTIDEKYLYLDKIIYSNESFVSTNLQLDSVLPIPVEKRLNYRDMITSKTEKYTPEGWTDTEIIANEDSNQLGLQFSTDEASAIFQQSVANTKSKQKQSAPDILVTIFSKLKVGYGVMYEPNLQLFAYQPVLGYQFNTKWSVLWQTAGDYNKFAEKSLGVEFRKNLNTAGYPILLGTSLFVSDRIYVSGYDYFKEQAITPQLSLIKRTSKYFTFEFFVNYPIPFHSEGNIKISNHYPSIGIRFYLF